MVDFRRPRSVAAVAGLVLALAHAAACGSAGSAAQAAPPCSLLTAAEVSAEAGSTFQQGTAFPSVSDQQVLGCPYGSPKGWVRVWTSRGSSGASAGWQDPPACPDGRLERADGAGYRAYACTTGANIQSMYVAKGDNYLEITIGAGAPPGAARALGALAVTRIS
ncbi:hypothetical protein I6A84_17840 [Frankia sp. CNm7]|uniref:DUF3558 domain-containing protein n=1 Tax=Frankia nepalensis TaxID=1836974 RepID=A0A937RMP6_9ACTN|nr:hypothetical protein [Frankia nepalensis]MBL7499456.1 hypothetical protein [Frankia nepalensis]MBL7511871.1 hypothetical protein [Frankia nepalensis]MBL7519904.1 hypothetical protein [Frankia nepalensis]MBL7629228.1 hypothetical protein [Frankia nepalensis]